MHSFLYCELQPHTVLGNREQRDKILTIGTCSDQTLIQNWEHEIQGVSGRTYLCGTESLWGELVVLHNGTEHTLCAGIAVTPCNDNHKTSIQIPDCPGVNHSVVIQHIEFSALWET